MNDLKIAVVGVGATGAVLGAALLSKDPEVILVDPKPGLGEALRKEGIRVSGTITYHVPVHHFFNRIEEIKDSKLNCIFLSTKTFHLAKVLEELEQLFQPGTKIVSTHNGLGTEDLIGDRFGKETAFRMSLNLGVSLKGPGEVEVAFFMKPNHLGGLIPENRPSNIS